MAAPACRVHVALLAAMCALACVAAQATWEEATIASSVGHVQTHIRVPDTSAPWSMLIYLHDHPFSELSSAAGAEHERIASLVPDTAPLVLVFPQGGDSWWYGDWETFVRSDLVAAVRARYSGRMQTSAAHTLVSGHGMGGFGALRAATGGGRGVFGLCAVWNAYTWFEGIREHPVLWIDKVLDENDGGAWRDDAAHPLTALVLSGARALSAGAPPFDEAGTVDDEALAQWTLRAPVTGYDAALDRATLFVLEAALQDTRFAWRDVSEWVRAAGGAPNLRTQGFPAVRGADVPERMRALVADWADVDGDVARFRTEPVLPAALGEALRVQRVLARDVPLHRAPMVGAHNAYNTRADHFLLPNQRWRVAAQLGFGARMIELDVHPVNGEALLCHASNEVRVFCLSVGWSLCAALGVQNYGANTGCMVETAVRLEDTLGDIRAWLDAHADDVVVLRMDSNMDTSEEQVQLGEALRAAFGPLLMEPGDCSTCDRDEWPSAAAMLARGHQVVCLQDDADGACFPAHTDRSPESHFARSDDGTCTERDEVWAPDTGYFRTVAESSLVYAWGGLVVLDESEDVGTLTAGVVADAQRCQATPTFDQLDPRERLANVVWSWEAGAPQRNASTCVAARGAGAAHRWTQLDCDAVRAWACVDTTSQGSEWRVTRGEASGATTPDPCTREFGAPFAVGVPRTLREADRLRAVVDASVHRDAGVWLALRMSDSESGWELDTRVDDDASGGGGALGAGAVAGVVVAALVGAVLVGAGVWHARRRARQAHRGSSRDAHELADLKP